MSRAVQIEEMIAVLDRSGRLDTSIGEYVLGETSVYEGRQSCDLWVPSQPHREAELTEYTQYTVSNRAEALRVVRNDLETKSFIGPRPI